MVPDFTTKPHEIYCGDAFEVLSQLDCKIDCVVTSPPYFKQRNYGIDGRELGQEKKTSEFVDALVKVFNEIDLQPWGNVWVNIGDKRGGKGELLAVPNKFVCAMLDAGWYLIDDVVWAERNRQGGRRIHRTLHD